MIKDSSAPIETGQLNCVLLFGLIVQGTSVLSFWFLYTAISFEFNSIEKLTDNPYKSEVGKSGLIKFKFSSIPDEKGKLLIESLIMGIIGIHDEYGDKYLELY